MRADNQGEGGILALLALLISSRSNTHRAIVIALALFGAALIYGDGMITPAISVLSAVEGFSVATPAFEPYVIPAAVVILIALFAVQQLGTGSIGAVFGPVMLVWFAVIAVMGIAQLVTEPVVLRALSPSYAVSFFIDNRMRGFLALGSVFLVVTGSEALFADMGHFGRRPITIGWLSVVFPSLMLNYAGQGATLLGDASKIDNPFYLMVPDMMRLPMAVLATAATVIASQALISGASSLTAQAVQLDYVPRLRVLHTSVLERGQIYVPFVNWTLMVACIGLVLGFGSSSRLAAAYGVGVTATMVIDSLLLFLIARERWRWPFWRAAALIAVFLVVDLAFFGANLFKIPDGGWVPLLIAALVFALMSTWRRGRDLVHDRLRGVDGGLLASHAADGAAGDAGDPADIAIVAIGVGAAGGDHGRGAGSRPDGGPGDRHGAGRRFLPDRASLRVRGAAKHSEGAERDVLAEVRVRTGGDRLCAGHRAGGSDLEARDGAVARGGVRLPVSERVAGGDVLRAAFRSGD